MSGKLWVGALTSALVLFGAGCSSETPTQPLVAGLNMGNSPSSIDADGSSILLAISAVDSDGKPGEGDVTFQATAGALGQGGNTGVATLANGRATIEYSCDAAVDPACQGTVTVTAAWKDQSATHFITVRAAAATPDAGSADSGTPDAGTPDSGTTDGGSADGGSGEDAGVQAGPPAGLTYFENPGTQPALGLRASGRDVATVVSFKVVDAQGVVAPQVPVDFSVSGPGGVKVSPAQVLTGADGVATTVLYSGDLVGIASVTASVADALVDPNVSSTTSPKLLAVSPGTSIVGATPSASGFVVECDQINLAASASVTPPRKDLSTNCSAKLVDGHGNPVGIPTQVNWLAEAGSINQVALSQGQTDLTPSAGTGVATTIFSTAGAYPPVDVPAMAGEYTNGALNQRDMLVTVIAIVSGEEQYWDGSGTGTLDGKYEPGEWFVDQGEPFIDENDDNQWEPGEPFTDTTWYQCDGTEVSPNGAYDGPNGCWDGPGNGRHPIQLWRQTHILYSGLPETAQFNPTSATVPAGGSAQVSFMMADLFGNPLAPDGAAFSVELAPALDGASAALSGVDGRLNARYYPFDVADQVVELDASTGSVVGPCNPLSATSQDGQFRCVRQSTYSNFVTGNSGLVLLSNSNSTAVPLGTATVLVTGSNAEGSGTAAFSASFQ